MKFAKEVLIVFFLCVFVVKVTDVTGIETGNISKSIKVVSLCEGCMIGETCVKEGIQKQESVGSPLYYCDVDHEAKLVKDIGELCMADYECEFYFCDNGYCNVKMEGEGASGILIGVLIGVVIILIIGVFLLYKLGIGFKKISKEEEKMEKEQKKPLWKESVKGIKTGSYRYRPEFDILEKKLKERLKK